MKTEGHLTFRWSRHWSYDQFFKELPQSAALFDIVPASGGVLKLPRPMLLNSVVLRTLRAGTKRATAQWPEIVPMWDNDCGDGEGEDEKDLPPAG